MNNSILWTILRVLLGGFMIFSGVGKLILDPAAAAEMFQNQFGYPEWMVWVAGGLEILGGLLLLIPATVGYGALLIAAVMAGATVTHWIAGDPIVHSLFPLVLFVLAALIARRYLFVGTRVETT